MLFPSIIFLFYFLPFTLLGYFFLSFSRSLQNLFLVITSLLFYAWGEPNNIVLLLFIVVINYAAALWIDHVNAKLAKVILAIAVIIDVLVLFIFKYTGFIVSNLQAFLPLPTFSIALPLGISFFTLQAISYVVDIYRKKGKAQRNPLNVALYIALFPQLIAGPIVRYTSIEKQIRTRRVTFHKISLGACRFMSGMIKKVLIANVMAVGVDAIFGWSSTDIVSVFVAWLGLIMYMFQIYYDFSGYSDMAIGLGLMFGFVFEENFNYPYISKSISEFWRRWHISLSSWIRDYIYIPLGGSRVNNKDTMIRNVLIVWFATGIWHGAEWTFLFWGLYNFVFIFIEKLLHFEEHKRYPLLQHIYTLLVICVSWVFFRSSNLHEAGIYFSHMFYVSGNPFFDDRAWMLVREYGIFILIAAIFSTPICRRFQKQLLDQKWKHSGVIIDCLYPLVMMLLFLICVTYIIKGSYNPFIYFNF